jgi:hypothetical protein
MTNWTRTIEIKQHLDPDKPLAEVRESIVVVLKADRAYRTDAEFEEIVDEMAEAPTVCHFDEMLSRLYDWADWNTIWIGGDLADRRASA